jgi:hypothetical protein
MSNFVLENGEAGLRPILCALRFAAETGKFSRSIIARLPGGPDVCANSLLAYGRGG